MVRIRVKQNRDPQGSIQTNPGSVVMSEKTPILPFENLSSLRLHLIFEESFADRNVFSWVHVTIMSLSQWKV